MDAKQQKEALKKVLEREFGAVEPERKFPWLVVPQREAMDQTIRRIREKLVGHRGFQEFDRPRRKHPLSLKCDFYAPGCKLIVEYDERQHFTAPRALCLGEYPSELTLGFDRQKWLEACRTTCARDNHPEDRDEQRAFYDTLRDLLAISNRTTLIRVRHGDWDWNQPASGEYIRELLRSP
jgi:hypothetical protein